MIVVVVGCQPKSSSIVMPIQLQLSDAPFNCQSEYIQGEEEWQLSQFQFYLSNPSVVINGETYPLSFVERPWQQKNIALLGEVCGYSSQWLLEFEPIDIALTDATLNFTLGVPFELNHLDPMTQQSPLNQSDMFWTWQLGHKFLRLDLQSSQAGWSFHLGSIGCSAPSPLRAPSIPCLQPNTVSVSINNISGNDNLVLDIAPLLSIVTLGENNQCMSFAKDKSCQLLLPAVGVNSQSSIFRVAL